MAVISEATVVDAVRGRDTVPADYVRRLERTVDAAGIGRATALTYLLLGGRYHPLSARRIGGAVGMMTRIVDDLLDGHGCDPVQDRGRFFDRFGRSIEEGRMPVAVEQDVEEAAYAAGACLHRFYTLHAPVALAAMTGTMEAMGERVATENKSRTAAYRSYVEAAGALHGELLVEALQVLPDFELDEEDRRIAQALGRAVQVTDDIVDGDVRLRDGDLRTEFDHAIAGLRSFEMLPLSLLTAGRPRHLALLIELEERLTGTM